MRKNKFNETPKTEILKKLDKQYNEIELVDILHGFIVLKTKRDEVKADAKFIKMLIDQGLRLEKSTKKTSSNCLMLASYFGLDEIVEELISKGFDVNATNDFGMNSFHWAVSGGEYYTAKLLMKKGADIYAKAEFETTWEYEHGFKTEKTKVSSLGFAFYNYNSEIIQMLIEKGISLDNLVVNELFIMFNKPLVNIMYDPEGSEALKDPIDIICEKNDVKILKLLIKNEHEFYKQDLMFACHHLNFEIIKLLVENGVKVDDFKKDNPLSAVCANSYKENGDKVLKIAKYLVEHGADINLNSPLMATCSTGYNPLMATCSSGDGSVDIDVIKFLIEHGADVNYTYQLKIASYVSSDKQTILTEAMKRENGYDLAKLLIDNGADVNNYKDKDGDTYLYLAKDEKVLQLLIESGANINAKNNLGFTPLMKHTMDGRKELVEILLKYGADINAKSEVTAYDLAEKDEIRELIQKTKNHNPQRLVEILSNFTKDTPLKPTTHLWEDPKGELFDRYGNFDGFIRSVNEIFDEIKEELKELSPNLYEKIYTFLIEERPAKDYSWCSQAHINIGWSSLQGLKEYCDNGNLPKDFKLPQPIFLGRRQISTFGEIVELFKKEIEVKAAYKITGLPDIEFSKRDFYTDTQKFSSAIAKIYMEMKKRKEYPQIEVTNRENLKDKTIEIKITQVGSFAKKGPKIMLEEIKDGDFADIKKSLTNLCDWSIENSYENENYRVNFLHSNNVKDIEILDSKPKGFTHVLRFYK